MIKLGINGFLAVSDVWCSVLQLLTLATIFKL